MEEHIVLAITLMTVAKPAIHQKMNVVAWRPFTLEELSESTQVIVRRVQNECFPDDVKEVRQNKKVNISSRLGSLRPVVEDGVP